VTKRRKFANHHKGPLSKEDFSNVDDLYGSQLKKHDTNSTAQTISIPVDGGDKGTDTDDRETSDAETTGTPSDPHQKSQISSTRLNEAFHLGSQSNAKNNGADLQKFESVSATFCKSVPSGVTAVSNREIPGSSSRAFSEDRAEQKTLYTADNDTYCVVNQGNNIKKSTLSNTFSDSFQRKLMAAKRGADGSSLANIPERERGKTFQNHLQNVTVTHDILMDDVVNEIATNKQAARGSADSISPATTAPSPTRSPSQSDQLLDEGTIDLDEYQMSLDKKGKLPSEMPSIFGKNKSKSPRHYFSANIISRKSTNSKKNDVGSNNSKSGSERIPIADVEDSETSGSDDLLDAMDTAALVKADAIEVAEREQCDVISN